MKTWIVNIFLAAAVVFFGIKANETWQKDQGEIAPAPDTQQARTHRKPSEIKRKTPLESDYRAIVEMNLFSPDRAEVIPDEPQQTNEIKKPAPPGNAITLFGVVIMDGYKKALVSNPDRSSDKREFLWIKENETIGSLNVLSIEKERILVAKNGKNFEIGMYDKNRSTGQVAQTPQDTTPEVISVEAKPTVKPNQKPAAGGKALSPAPFSGFMRKKGKN